MYSLNQDTLIGGDGGILKYPPQRKILKILDLNRIKC